MQTVKEIIEELVSGDLEKGHEVLVNNHKISLGYDYSCDNPLVDWDCMPHFLNLSKKYDLGDSHIDSKSGETFYIPDDFDSPDDIEAFLDKNDYVYFRVYATVHGGITLCPAYLDRFDSGTFGFLYISKQELREWGCVKKLSKKIISETEQLFEEFAKNTLENYLNGDVYHLQIDDESYNCYGYDDVKSILENKLHSILPIHSHNPY
ncbi:hypothetical protein [Campylobacter fetus]|uniref:hypothetical protein n=1 Tax=Campylobacter fetus TaxID=196 RepID=UPI00112F956E|nr:hypothetical protein [Campylobacter fetus]